MHSNLSTDCVSSTCIIMYCTYRQPRYELITEMLTFDTKLALYAASAFKYSFLANSVFFLYTCVVWEKMEKKKIIRLLYYF